MSEEVLNQIERQRPGLIDTIAQNICERHDPKIKEGDDGSLYIADRQNIDACNEVIVGSFWASGIEYAFEAENGNNAGWVWRSVSSDSSIPDIEIIRTQWALEPRSDIVAKAIMDGQESILLIKWDALLSRKEIASIPQSYGYDKHFSPGLKTNTYWREKAAEYGFVLVSDDQAKETRARLNTPESGERDAE
jgi:hypothetical protein